mmetsp:Transcript_3048/g.5766  ORF Transcript_3048/g.5766 Transcript_3048/m.5766 type:complete len:1031 (+) Transcript_3048:82-3174(+)
MRLNAPVLVIVASWVCIRSYGVFENWHIDEPLFHCFMNQSERAGVHLIADELEFCKGSNATKDCWELDDGRQVLLCEYVLQLEQARGECLQGVVSVEDFCADTVCSASGSFDGTGMHTLDVLESFPKVHKSFKCQNCGFRQTNSAENEIVFFEDSEKPNRLQEQMVVAENRWSLFLENARIHTKTKLHITRQPMEKQCSRYIDRPTYIFDFLGWHVGHLIIDVLEPLYYAMQSIGEVGRDSLLFFDVADKDDVSQFMASIIARDVFGGSTDTIFQLLRLFTKFSIHSKRALELLQGATCFTNVVHIQLDISNSFSVAPQPFPMPKHSEVYQGFQEFILSNLRYSLPHSDKRPGGKNVAIVERIGSRVISNFQGVVDELLKIKGISLHVLRLELLSFSEQVKTLQETDILICQQGTAAHNILFMNPGSSLVILMQPEWCRWHWQFSRQAELLGQSVFVVCDDTRNIQQQQTQSIVQSMQTGGLSSLVFHPVGYRVKWHSRGWLQGPCHTKPSDISPNAQQVSSVVQGALLPTRRQSVTVIGHMKEHAVGVFSEALPMISDFELKNGVARTTLELYFLTNSTQFFHPEINLAEEYMTKFQTCFRVINLEKNCQLTEPLPSDQFCVESTRFNEHSWLEFHNHGDDELIVMEYWLQPVNKQQVEPQIPSRLHIYFPMSKPISNGMLTPQWSLDDSIVVKVGQVLVSIRPPGDSGPGADNKLSAFVWVQLVAAQTCLLQAFDPCQCAQLSVKMMRAVENKLSTRAPEPSKETPFVFLHLEKTAGTCVRYVLANYFRKRRDTSKPIIPCYFGVRCETFSLENFPPERLEDVPLIAGHFEWGVWQQLHARDAICFTMMRHPVSRVISFYYERVYDHSGVLLNDLPLETLSFYLEHWRGSAFGKYRDEGMSNAACKMLCGLSQYKGLTPEEAPRKYDGPPCTEQLAIERLGKCVVGIQEDWPGSVRVITHNFPWLKQEVLEGCPNTTHGSNQRSVVFERTPADLRPEIRSLIESKNECDILLYEASKRQFLAQLSRIP